MVCKTTANIIKHHRYIVRCIVSEAVALFQNTQNCHAEIKIKSFK